MANKIFLVFCLLLAVLPAIGQDIITRSDGVVIKAMALEIQPSLIRFRLFQQADTGVYQISSQDVQSIKGADGTTKNFTSSGEVPTPALPFNYETSSGRNILWYSPLDLFYSNFRVAYERILASGKAGFKIPLIIGLSDGNYNTDLASSFRENNRFGAGLEFNFYPFGQGRFQYYFGPAFQARSFRGYYVNGTQPEPQGYNGEYFSLGFQNGIYYQFTKHFIISADGGVGLRRFREPEMLGIIYYPGDRKRGFVSGTLHLGCRF